MRQEGYAVKEPLLKSRTTNFHPMSIMTRQLCLSREVVLLNVSPTPVRIEHTKPTVEYTKPTATPFYMERFNGRTRQGKGVRERREKREGEGRRSLSFIWNVS